jgi:hypothetical protein
MSCQTKQSKGIHMRRKNSSLWQYLGVVIVLGIVVAAGWWFFSPAFIDKEVNEPLPIVVVEASPAPAPAETNPRRKSSKCSPNQRLKQRQPNQPRTKSLERLFLQFGVHVGAGEAVVYQLADGSRILRLQNFSVDNGPDLYVYLVPIDPVPNASGSDIPGYYSLGRLKGNIGDQNYELPADLDLSQYKSVVIWCQAFAVPFSAAPLTAQ